MWVRIWERTTNNIQCYIQYDLIEEPYNEAESFGVAIIHSETLYYVVGHSQLILDSEKDCILYGDI